MKLIKPKNLKGVNGMEPIAVADIVPYLPPEDCFFDSRHWVCETLDGGGILPFSLTTRIEANHQQYLKIYEQQTDTTTGEGKL